jgi:hypothetical protein
MQTDKISQQPENCENRNDPDLVQAFRKKWWVESDFKTMNKNRNHAFDFSHLSCLDLFLIQIIICLYFTTDVKHNDNSVIVNLTGLPV